MSEQILRWLPSRRVRASATWLVPRAWSGPGMTCPHCHGPQSELCCNSPDGVSFTSTLQCKPQDHHGIGGLMFCGQCGGAVRVITADEHSVAVWNDGGPPHSEWAWMELHETQHAWMEEEHPGWPIWMERQRELYGLPAPQPEGQ